MTVKKEDDQHAKEDKLDAHRSRADIDVSRQL